jgi:CspA family cold shock protein
MFGYMLGLFRTAQLDEEVVMSDGTIKTITDRGFGFIRPENGTEDVFFHRSALAGGADFDRLQQGDRVTFNAENDPRGKGMRASNVQLVTT